MTKTSLTRPLCTLFVLLSVPHSSGSFFPFPHSLLFQYSSAHTQDSCKCSAFLSASSHTIRISLSRHYLDRVLCCCSRYSSSLLLCTALRLHLYHRTMLHFFVVVTPAASSTHLPYVYKQRTTLLYCSILASSHIQTFLPTSRCSCFAGIRHPMDIAKLQHDSPFKLHFSLYWYQHHQYRCCCCCSNSTVLSRPTWLT